jgi:hypothetical protein
MFLLVPAFMSAIKTVPVQVSVLTAWFKMAFNSDYKYLKLRIVDGD